MCGRYITVLECIEVSGFCPVYQVGSKIVIDECLIWRADDCLVRYREDCPGSANCYPFLVDIAPYFRCLCKGVPPSELGIAGEGGQGYLTCKNLPVRWYHEKGYYTHGNVTFKVTLIPTEKNYNDVFDDELRERNMPPYGSAKRALSQLTGNQNGRRS